MKLRKTKKNYKKVIITSIIVVIVLGLGVTTFALYRQHVDTQSKAAQIKQEQDTNNQGKKDFIENTNADGSSSSGTTPVTPPSSSVTVSAQKESNGSVTVFTKLISVSAGTCNLSITNGNNTLTKSANVIYQTDYSSCAGFTISSQEAAQLGTGGWSISLSVVNGSSTYTGAATFTYEAN